MIRLVGTRWLAAGLAWLAVGCDGEPAVDPVSRVDILGGGIVRVTNLPDHAPHWRLELRRQFADSAGTELSDPSEIVVDDSGRVYVLDDDPAVIRVYGPDGAPLRTIGREGGGPGEFQGGGMLLLSGRTLVHQDPRQSRAQAFALDGALLGQWPSPCCVRVPTRADTLGRFPLPGDVGRIAPGGDDAGAGMGYIRYRQSGTVADTLDFPPAPLPRMWRATDGRNRWNRWIPLQPQVTHVLDRAGRMIWGNQRTGEWVVSRTGRDTLALFNAREVPVPVPDSIRQGVVSDLVRSNPLFEPVAKVEDVPTRFPSWMGLSVDAVNRLWVLRPGPTGESDHWHLFSSDGHLLARIATPQLDAERLWITERLVYAIEPDAATGLDVVRVYEIVQSER